MTEEELSCIGCGAKIQTENADERGYTPNSALAKGIETGQLLCQRCFRLRHYNQLEKVEDRKEAVAVLLEEYNFNGQDSYYIEFI